MRRHVPGQTCAETPSASRRMVRPTAFLAAAALTAVGLTAVAAVPASAARAACPDAPVRAQAPQPPATGLGQVPVEGERLLDTRNGLGTGGACLVAPGSRLDVDVLGRGGVPASGVAAVQLNLTAVGTSAHSWVAAVPGGAPHEQTSSLTTVPGETRAAMVTVPVGPDGTVTLVTGGGSADLLVDVLGYYPADGSGQRLRLTEAFRASDRRSAGWSPVSVASPEGTGSAVLNVTVDQPADPVYVSVVPGRVAGGTTPGTSTANSVPGRTVANSAVTRLADGSVSLFASTPVRSIVDVVGYHGEEGAAYHPLTPSRVVDSRRGTGASRLQGARPQSVQLTGRAGVPAGAGAVLATVTLAGTDRSTHLTVWPDGAAKPPTSAVNGRPEGAAANLVTIPLDDAGRAAFELGSGSSDVVVDVLGWYDAAEVLPAPEAPETTDSTTSTRTPLNPQPGKGVAVATGTTFTDGRVAMAFHLDSLPTAGALYLGGHLRMTGTRDGYRPRLKVLPDGSLRLDVRRVASGVEQVVGTEVVLPAKVKPGQTLHFEAELNGTSTVSLRSRAWTAGTSRPDWQLRQTHTGSGVVSTAGDSGLWAYLSSSSAPVAASYSGLVGTPVAAPAPTPTPTPTPTPAPAPAPGTVKPGPDNTGVPAGTSLRVHQGDLVLNTPGQVVDGLDVRGFVRVSAPNVTVRRSIIRGGPAVRVEGVVTVNPTATNFVIEDSEVYPSQPSVKLDGIKGANFTARRVHVHGGVDNIKVHGSNVLIESSYLHDQHYYASDPLQNGGPTHNDALQVLGGDNIRAVGNTIISRKELNAAVQVTQDFAPVTRMQLDRNWISGGGCSVNVNHKKLADLYGVTMRDNVFARTSTRYSNCGIILTTKAYPTLSGNRYDDGTAVTPKYMAPS
ncbi:right-handed parallel beta-helix repeat-containing protein [Thalassiella azotivora]